MKYILLPILAILAACTPAAEPAEGSPGSGDSPPGGSEVEPDEVSDI